MITTFDCFTKATLSAPIKARVREAMASAQPTREEAGDIHLTFEPDRKQLVLTPADAANPDHIPTARIAYAAASSMLDGRFEAINPQDIEEYDD